MQRARPVRWSATVAVLLGLLVLAGCATPETRRVADGSCTDFATQAEAQRAANTLDGDEDGRFCERLPCPCAGPGSPGAGDDESSRPRREDRRSRGTDDRTAVAAQPAVVTRVVDGDTIEARLPDGASRTVRLVGIDTPETSTLRSGSRECGGLQATRATEDLARRWRSVTLRPDPTQDAFDRYGRLLAYVEPRSEPGRSFQEELLSQGWAKVYVYGTPFARVDRFRAAARRAEAAGAGVWRSCDGEFRRPIDD